MCKSELEQWHKSAGDIYAVQCLWHTWLEKSRKSGEIISHTGSR